MKKPGEWIAILSANLEVSRLDVAANEVLDLVEVTEIDRVSGRPSSVRFLDRVEGARLRTELGAALDVLERAAIEETERPTRPRWEPVFVVTGGGERIWTVEDTIIHETGPQWRGADAEEAATREAERRNRDADHTPAPSPGP